MPISSPSFVSVPGQVDQSSQAQTTGKNFRKMVGEVLDWNPDAGVPLVKTWLNNAYRSIIDAKNWYGMLVRGQIAVPNVYSTGQATFTLGSPTVTGSGTAWDQTFVGRQIRSGFQTGWYNISKVVGQTLTLDLPWGNPTVTNAGYQICQTWVTLGYNIKYVLDMVNQRQGWRLGVNVPQQALNEWDAWRTTTGWTQILANRPPSASGQPMYELWPAPTFQQAFPFMAYVQPPDMVKDADFPASFIRSDVIIKGALAEALVYRGKTSRYYDPATSAIKSREFAMEIEKMRNTDNNLYQRDFQWEYAGKGFSEYGSLWSQNHPPAY